MNFQGASFAGKKQSQKIRLENSGPKFGRPKFVSQNSALNSGSGGAKSPVQTFVSDLDAQIFTSNNSEPLALSSTKIVSQNRSNHGGCKRARKHSNRRVFRFAGRKKKKSR